MAGLHTSRRTTVVEPSAGRPSRPKPFGDSDSSDPTLTGATAYLYQSIFELLEQKVASRAIPAGAVLKEAAVATHLNVSRAPVRRALAMLADRGLIRPADGQGYIVGEGSGKSLSSRELHDILDEAADEINRSATWERIFTRVSEEVTSLLPFGTYRIQEAELGDHHDVSRTVAREVLWRLMDVRLIEKDRKSHWIAGQMTARVVRDTLEMRRVLEPQALANVAPMLDRSWLESLARRIETAVACFPTCGAAEIDAIEKDMFGTMYAGLRNTRMLGSIRRNQVALIVPRLFRQHFPVRDDLPALVTYGQIARLVCADAIEAAQILLRTQIERSEPLVLARLRVLSILPPPATQPYIIAVH
jgi:DNA-binding GntR family transcriptional regulator